MHACFLGLIILLPASGGLSAAEAEPDAAMPDSTFGVVFLDKSHGPELLKDRGLLIRELFRQAFSIAARDELGLITRDAWLGDPMPTKGNNEPFSLRAGPERVSLIEIVRGFPPDQKLIVSCNIAFSGYKDLVIGAEKLSRTKLVKVYKKSGVEGRPNKRKSDAKTTEEIERYLADMTFTSQFMAVRLVHQAIRDQGESASLLGALVRGYANLGVLTEFHWHPAHKVFKARALLYAQRLLVLEPKTAWAKWHRAYAFALTGLQRYALTDLKDAEKDVETAPEKDGTQKPAWVDHIHAYCKYEIDKLVPSDNDKTESQLTLLLRYMAIEQSTPDIRPPKYKAARVAWNAMPECYRVYYGLCSFGTLRDTRIAKAAAPKLLGQNIYRRLKAIPELPAEVRTIVKQHKSAAGLEKLFLRWGRPTTSTSADEFKTRAELIIALRDTASPLIRLQTTQPEVDTVAPDNQPPNVNRKCDTGELSWAVLGHLIRAVSSEHICQYIHSTHSWHPGRVDEFLADAAPLVAEHLQRAFVESHCSDSAAKREALRRLAESPPERVEFQSWGIKDTLGPRKREEYWRQMLSSVDCTTYDLVRLLPCLDERRKPKKALWLLEINPHSPYARAILVEHDWNKVKQYAAEWDKEATNHVALLVAFGRRYLAIDRYADAERCLKAALKLQPERKAYEALAKVYLRQGDKHKWMATLEEFLEKTVYSLEHAQVYTTIAREYMKRKEWDRALPYAENAARTYSQWGLQCACYCYEGLQKWEQAEDFARATSQGYSPYRTDWYFFCKRTGQGDLESARKLAHQQVKELEMQGYRNWKFSLFQFYLLEKDLQKALALVEQKFVKTNNPWFGLHAALLADQLKDSEKRDRLLQRIKTRGHKYVRHRTDKPRTELIALAAILAEDLANGGKGEIDTAVADKLSSIATAGDDMNFNYYLAKYFGLHGKPDKAIEYWKRCMGYVQMRDINRTLAGAELSERGVTPDSYKTLLHKDPADDRKDSVK